MTCTCDTCKVYECMKQKPALECVPENCPMLDKAFAEKVAKRYEDPEVKRMYIAAKTAGDGLRKARFVPRLRRLIDLCKNMNYKKIGLSYCVHFRKEAEQYAEILRRHGLEVVTMCCTNGALDQKQFGFGDTECEFREACNPIGLAECMNREKVEFNFLMGVCTGQDSLFYKFTDAMTTVIAINDPVTGHTPTKALYLYNSYYDRFFDPNDDPSTPPLGVSAPKDEEKKEG